MSSPFRSFSSLFSTTLIMVLGAGLLTTYLALSLARDGVEQLWIGGMMSAYYFGLVVGSKVGHRLIARVGHIRTFVASAGIVTASALGHALTDVLEIWLILRLIVGTGMMCQYMVLESWLNEQAESNQRGTVFAGYMIVSYLGMVGGQTVLSLFPELGLEPLLLVGICYALCIVPIALTRRIHPQPLHPAPLKILTFWRKVPQSLTTILIAGGISGSFYGLAPAFAAGTGLSNAEVATFMSATILAGLLAQWPMGKLSDRIPRSRLLRVNSALLGVLVLTISLVPISGWLLLLATFFFGILAFTLYPLATALANQNIEQTERVALSATILLTFGIGATLGPLVASFLMQLLGNSMLYLYMAVCCFILFLRLTRVNYNQKTAKKLLAQQQSSDYQLASGDLVSSPLGAALDPRVDEELVQQQMRDEPLAEQQTTSTIVDDKGDIESPAVSTSTDLNASDTADDTVPLQPKDN
ncbi:MFS transporter [Alishewanella longhuensis]|uniref:MFS transporter n=1 Tax=Alishewanella longhuensis TaxID=1091037 RepID=A0ABQ3L1S3_9ALTE|nr:MFS transporter [Alishewanella longhuensis]GHG77243.1 MFS transporter [Alishewanella longhuensis]